MTTLALLPIHLTKAFVRGHLRNLGGRMVEVKPYHTKTQPKRDDDRTREMFGDIPPAGNQIQPRMHPARTTKPRAPVIPFKTAFPQLFEEKEVASVQNGQYNKDKGRNPAPATGSKAMTTLNDNQKRAMSYMIGQMRRSEKWERGLYEHAFRWAGFNEWSGTDTARRYYFNDPAEPNEKMFGHIENREVKWNGGYEGATKKAFKELNARHVQKMQAAYDKAMAEMAAYIEENRQSLPIFGEGTVGEVRGVPGHPELGPYTRMENGKWEHQTTTEAPATDEKDTAKNRVRKAFERTLTLFDEHIKKAPTKESELETKIIKELIKNIKAFVESREWSDEDMMRLDLSAKNSGYRYIAPVEMESWAIKRGWKRDRGEEGISDPTPEKAAATGSPRLTAAADYLEKKIRAEGYWDDDSDEDVVAAKNAIKALRETTRKDLDDGVWASVFSVLGVKNADYIANLLTEQEGKGFNKPNAADRIYLTVPFAEKDRVKAKGAKWDGDKKKWYWPTSAGDMPAVVKGYAK